MASSDFHATEMCLSLQGLLRSRALSPSSARLLFYPLGGLSQPPNVVSYTTLYGMASHRSLVLANMSGFSRGAPVILYLDDHWDTILWFWVIVLAHGIPVLSPTFPRIDRDKHLDGLSELLESPICITRAASRHDFEGARHDLQVHVIESLEEGIPQAQAPDAACPDHINLGEAMRDAPKTPGESSVAVLMMTSGSTGSAKAVRLTHSQILAAVTGKASVRPLPKSGAFLNWIRLDHVASLVEIHIQALWLHVDQVHVHPADLMKTPMRFLEILSLHHVSRSFAPNFFLARLIQGAPPDQLTLHDCNLSNLVILASGGEANDIHTGVAASKLLMKYGAPENVITPGFGMTETGAGAVFNTDFPAHDVVSGREVASLGRCMPGIEMRVLDQATGTSAASGMLGDLEVRGPVVFDGYYRNAAATSKAISADGWFRTGDRASIDSHGNLCLAGRRDDVVNINGVKFATAALQSALDTALVDTCADRVVIFPSRSPGASSEQVTVAYIPRRQPPEAHDLVKADELAIEACMMVDSACKPLVFSIGKSVPVLPLSTLGKISSSKMRAMFENGSFEADIESHRRLVSEFRRRRQQTPAQTTLSETESLVRLDFAESIGKCAEAIDIETPLFELGFTSMDLIRLKVRIDTRLGITMDTVLLLKHPTVRSLSCAVEGLLQMESDTSSAASTQRSPIPEAVYDPVVTFIPKGTKTPLWLIHPGIGEVLVFVGLSQYMRADDRPVYGLRARGLEPGQRSFESVTEAVGTYVTAIRRVQPQGPYAIAGYSYGAMLAFEITKKLESEDSDGVGAVRFLGTFNLPLPHLCTRLGRCYHPRCAILVI
ncbi:acetyl-CoA synthetase-like protein [Xylariaceae sp. FL0804]|nr:acetyl-CoA synthetase-like protein [Xylariaceae sp. FL0804]